MKKVFKILSLALAIIMLSLSLSSSVVAAETCYSYDGPDGLNPEDFAEANAELIRIGQMAQMQRNERYLSVVHYYQSGQSWSNDIMQNAGLTIGKSGCTLTSFAMIQRYLGGTDDPGQVNVKMGNYACDKDTGFSYTVAATKYNFTIINRLRDETKIDIDTSRSFIIGGINTYHPVLVGLKKSQSVTHFVVAYGHLGNTIYIHDPASGRDYTLLSDYLDEGYNIHRLYICDK